MAIHREVAALPVEVVEEYLIASELCLSHRKEDGGCLGYPATLLLFCVVNAIGGYLALRRESGISQGEPFLVLNHPCFGLTLKPNQMSVATLERRVEKSDHKTKPRAASIRRA
jgi:hypothetical protein